MQALELLAPAKNLETGKAAIDHGADAVYIGAPRHGARAAAGNSIDDIAELCRYAHLFNARVHVTVNTIIYDHEMDDTLDMVDELCAAGIDALLVQDMGLLSRLQNRNLRGVDLHASTQCDTRTVEKVKWLHALGFKRVVLARELSADEIAEIHRAVPDVELEVFVHGALCVSYSGACYASQHAFGRSANRGECAQLCRMKYDLIDDNGHEIERQRYLLSLKDLCQLDRMDQLIEAGACSFKIEGRLKDINYVKNVVSAYSQTLDRYVARHPDSYRRVSIGQCHYAFQADLAKTFNRGYTHYFLNGRQPNIFSPDTPKAIGEFVGKVKDVRRDSIIVAGTASFTNGDGLCYINDEHELEGFRVNRAIGNALFPYRLPRGLKRGMPLYRNNDQSFERLLNGKTAKRKIMLDMRYSATADGFRLSIGKHASAEISFEHQEAKRPQRDNLTKQLTRLGDTIYEARLTIDEGSDLFFVPNSLLAELRRAAIENYEQSLAQSETPDTKSSPSGSWEERQAVAATVYPSVQQPMSAWGNNIANADARKFYERQGAKNQAPAFELVQSDDAWLMQCRHCLRFALGYCVKHGGQKPTWREPLHLVLGDGRRFRLEFACQHCQMNVYAEK